MLVKFDKVIGKVLNEDTALPLGVLTFFLFHNSYFYRKLKGFVIPITSFAIIYRALTDAKTNLLSHMYNKFFAVNSNKVIRNVMGDICGIGLCFGVVKTLEIIVNTDFIKLKNVMYDKLFSLVKLLPPVKAKVTKEFSEMEKGLEMELKAKTRAMGDVISKLPAEGQNTNDIISFMKKQVDEENNTWKDGVVSGTVYHGNKVTMVFTVIVK
jgi:hypothetical protein